MRHSVKNMHSVDFREPLEDLRCTTDMDRNTLLMIPFHFFSFQMMTIPKSEHFAITVTIVIVIGIIRTEYGIVDVTWYIILSAPVAKGILLPDVLHKRNNAVK